MNRTWAWAAWIILLAGLAAPAQEQAGNPYYVDGMLVDQYKQSDPEEAAAPVAGPNTMSLRDAPAAGGAPQPSVAPAPKAPGVALPPAGKALEHLRAANMFVEKKEWDKALEEIQRGLESDPQNALLLRRGSAVAALAKNFTAADDYYRRLLMVDPNSVAFMNGRASVQIRLRQFVPAQVLTDRALELQPGDLLARFNRLLLKVIRNEPLEGESWSDLLTFDAAQVANWLEADKADYLQMMSAEQFALACQTALGAGLGDKLSDAVGVLRRLGQAQRLQQWDKVLAIVQEARGMGLQAMGLEMDQARAVMEQGDRDQARSIMKSLSERFPEHPQVLYNYGYILIEDGSYAEALALLDRAYAKIPNHPQIAFARACMLSENNRIDEAWPILAGLIRDYPAETRTWLQEEDPYLAKIKADPRYQELLATRVPKRRPAGAESASGQEP